MVEIPLFFASEGGNAVDLASRVAMLASRRNMNMVAEGFDAALVRVGDGDDLVAEADPVAVLRQRCAGSSGLAVFFISTTGDGEVPKNMQRTWFSLLRRSLGADALLGIKFAVYALGDRAYGQKFCAAARKFEKRLTQLGATLLCPTVLADDSDPSGGGVLSAFGPWLKDSLWPCLLAVHPLPATTTVDDSPRLDPPLVDVLVVAAQPPSTLLPLPLATAPPPPPVVVEYAAGGCFSLLGLGEEEPLWCAVRANERLSAADWQQDVRRLALALPQQASTGDSPPSPPAPTPPPPALAWLPGDVAWVLPENSALAVAAMLAYCGLDPTQLLHVTPRSSSAQGGGGAAAPSFVGAVSARELFARVLDVEAMPRPFAFEQLSLLATKEEESEKLLEISQPEGADLYLDYCYRERRGWFEVLAEFGSLSVPLPHLLNLIPRLQPRAFSIASPPPPPASAMTTTMTATVAPPAGVVETGSVGAGAGPGAYPLELCVAVVEYSTRYGRKKAGVCSSWVASCSPANLTDSTLAAAADAAPTTRLVPVWIRPGTFPSWSELLCDVSKPLVLVGPGTGIAPMRAIALARVEERRRIRRKLRLERRAGGDDDSGAVGQGRRRKRRDGGVVEEEQEMDDDDDDDDDEDSDDEDMPHFPQDLLFFGCRRKAKDFLFGEELTAVAMCDENYELATVGSVEEHVIARRKRRSGLRLVTAFSRDEKAPATATAAKSAAGGGGVGGTAAAPPPPAPPGGELSPPALSPPPSSPSSRCYVTHRLRQHGPAVKRCLGAQRGAVLVAGSAGAMPRDVHTALLDLLVNEPDDDADDDDDDGQGGGSGGGSKDGKHLHQVQGDRAKAANFLRFLERRRRYCIEAYG